MGRKGRKEGRVFACENCLLFIARVSWLFSRKIEEQN